MIACVIPCSSLCSSLQEAIFTILALRDGVAPPTLNLSEVDGEVVEALGDVGSLVGAAAAAGAELGGRQLDVTASAAAVEAGAAATVVLATAVISTATDPSARRARR